MIEATVQEVVDGVRALKPSISKSELVSMSVPDQINQARREYSPSPKEKQSGAMKKKMNAKSVIEDMEINKELMSGYHFN